MNADFNNKLNPPFDDESNQGLDEKSNQGLDDEMSEAPSPELGWLAFRYISGELSAEEIDAFEKRLDIDQAARDAVAEAVELSDLVVAGFELDGASRQDASPATPREGGLRTGRTGRLGWTGAGIAAIAASLVVMISLVDRTSEPAPSKTGDGTFVSQGLPGGDALALAWNEVHAAGGSDLADADVFADPDSEVDGLDPGASTDLDNELPPDWLVVAISIHSNESSARGLP
ncbi:hypothetical protein Pan216_43200 [Planctomycetes bacterium Pan216]|uniref:Zinc-finger domain-containing protein n=1 Tax=Kolteria novifilia TaxID=2527975 RepID=A0A518B8Y5_9BACT|nr:hypothetical protein Pan216_43200 [Planctomycetes bacterium Pan216]